MSQVFECPSCGAGLNYAGIDDPVITCSYCGKQVIVPEDLRARQPQAAAWTAVPFSGAPLAIDLSGLSGKFATLKAVKQLVRDGRLDEAAQNYQQAFGASAEEARGVVERLAAGQSVVISSANFSQVLPVVSGTQVQVLTCTPVAQVVREQLSDLEEKQVRSRRRFALVFMVAIIGFVLIMMGAAVVMLMIGN